MKAAPPLSSAKDPANKTGGEAALTVSPFVVPSSLLKQLRYTIRHALYRLLRRIAIFQNTLLNFICDDILRLCVLRDKCSLRAVLHLSLIHI